MHLFNIFIQVMFLQALSIEINVNMRVPLHPTDH